VRATIGETFEVRLEGTPTSGYTWELDPHGLPDVAEFAAADMISSAGLVAGGPAVQIFRFRAVREGEGRIRFRYRRHWEAVAACETEVGIAVNEPPLASDSPPPN